MVKRRQSHFGDHPWMYGLIALIAAFSLLHAAGGAIATGKQLFARAGLVQQPFSVEFGMPVVRDRLDAANKAGLKQGDIVLTVNGRPFTGLLQLRDLTRSVRPGQTFRVTYVRPLATSRRWQNAEQSGLPARTAVFPTVALPPLTPWAVTLDLIFFFVPLCCLLTGLYVTVAKPFSLQAWCVFVVLAFPDCVFYSVILMPSALFPPALFWNHLVQALLPMAILLFGVTFPDRSSIDRHAPWLKWALLLPLLAFVPYDFLVTAAYFYDFGLFPGLAAGFLLQARIGNAFSLLCALYFIVALSLRNRDSAGDSRRRLRILYAGATLGLGAFFIFVLTSVLLNKSLNDVVPSWLFLALLGMLLLFPLSLAYVVVVQRAMELGILLRQGTKYFFARQSVVVVRVLLTVWLAVALTKFSLHPDRRRATDFVQIGCIIALFALYRLVLGAKAQQKIDQLFFRDAYSAEQVLSDLSDEARTFTEVQPLLSTVTQRISTTLHIDRVSIFLLSQDQYQLQFATGGDPSVMGEAPLQLPAASSTIDTLSREKHPSVVYQDDPKSWPVDATDAERTTLRKLSAELLVPLPGRNRLLGVMTLGPKRSEEPYSRMDRQLLQSVASQTGLALENAELLQSLTLEIAQRERISSEIEIARDVQQRLFPQSYPQIAGLDLAGHCRPAQAVGGDYYDLFATDSHRSGRRESLRLGLAIGDISGKGISASLLMASLRAALRIAARIDTPGERNIAEMMRQVNQLVFESSSSNRYATFFFAELEPTARMLTYVNAGHNPPLVLRKGQVIPLPPTGPVVGLLEGATFEQSTMQLQPGDVLLAYTDGISEAMNLADEEWGEQAMLQTAVALAKKPEGAWSAASLVECLFREADQFTAGAPQHDDMTVVVCAVR